MTKTLNPAVVETTINVGKLTHNIQFKKRAPRALRGIRDYASKMMKTEDVRINPTLNKHLWSKGIRNLPNRVRVSMARLRDEENDSFYTVVDYVPVDDFTGLQHSKQE